MHILFLTDNFPPEVNAPASRTIEHAKQWVNSGHKVTIVTSVPNFPKGKPFKGYRNKAFQKEVIDGIEVVRVWTFIAANERILKRLIDQISFMPGAILASFFIKKVDIIVGTSPNFFAAFAAYIVSIFKRRPWVFELRDIWPASIRALGAMSDSWLLDLFERVELFLYRRASSIVTVTASFKKDLTTRGRIDPSKIIVVTNGVDLHRFSPRQKNTALMKRLGLENKFILGYIGTHGVSQSLETLLRAAAFAQNSSSFDDLHFLFVGEGAEKNKLTKLADQLSLKNISFIDSVAKEEIVDYWALLDASIIHLKDIPLFKTVIPSKSFESMAMGIPILLGAHEEGEIATIIKNTNSGIVFEPENADALLEAVLELRRYDDVRRNISVHAMRASLEYSRQKLASEMLKIFENLKAE